MVYCTKRILNLTCFYAALAVLSLIVLVCPLKGYGHPGMSCNEVALLSGSLRLPFIVDNERACILYKEPWSDNNQSPFRVFKKISDTLGAFFLSFNWKDAPIPLIPRTPLLAPNNLFELNLSIQRRSSAPLQWIKSRLILDNTPELRRLELDQKFQQVVNHQQKYAGLSDSVHSFSTYLSIVNQKPVVVVVPPEKLMIEQQGMLYETFFNALLTSYLSLLNTSVLIELLPALMAVVSVATGAGGDGGDGRVNYDQFPFDFHIYPETTTAEQWLNALIKLGLGQKNQLLDILQNRMDQAIEGGNTNLALVLRDRIMIIEADWQDIREWANSSATSDTGLTARITLLLTRLLTNAGEVQEYQDMTLIRMMGQYPVFLSDNPSDAIIIASHLNQEEAQAYAVWQLTAAGMMYIELKKRLGSLLQNPSSNHNELTNLVTNLETLVRQFYRDCSKNMMDNDSGIAVGSDEEVADADAAPKGQQGKGNTGNDRPGRGGSRDKKTGSGGDGKDRSFDNNNEGDNEDQGRDGDRNPHGADSAYQAQFDQIVDSLVAVAGNGDVKKVQSILGSMDKDKLLLGQSKRFNGDTALHAAIRNNHNSIVKIIEAHAHTIDGLYDQLILIKNNEDKTPLQLQDEPSLPYVHERSAIIVSTAQYLMEMSLSDPVQKEYVQFEKSQQQKIIDELVKSAERGAYLKISILIGDFGKAIFWQGSSYNSGNTALHAAFQNEKEQFVKTVRERLGDGAFRELLQLTNNEGKTPIDLGSEDFVKKVLDSMGENLEAIRRDIQEYDGHSADDDPDRYGKGVQYETFGQFEKCSYHHQKCYNGVFQMPCCSTDTVPKFICEKGILKVLQNVLIKKRINTKCFLCESDFNLLSVLKMAEEHFQENKKQLEEAEKTLSIQDSLKCGSQMAGIDMLIAVCHEIRKTLAEYLEGKHLFDNSLNYQEKQECCVCLDVTPEGCFSFPACDHPICLECWAQHFWVSSTDIDALRDGLCCPGEADCKTPVPDHVVTFLTGSEALRKINKILMMMAVNANQNLFSCLNEQCNNVMELDESTKGTQKCSKCEKTFCAQCMVTPGHDGLDCKTFKKALTEDGADSLFETVRKSDPDNYKISPCCGLIVYKDGGCAHMHCKQCRKNFCWRCMQELDCNKQHFRGKSCVSGRAILSARRAAEINTRDQEPDTGNQEASACHQEPNVGDEITPPCQKCNHPTSILLQCSHHFCNNCYQTMLENAGRKRVIGNACTMCQEELALASGQQNSRSNEPDDSGLLSEATGYTLRERQYRDQYTQPIMKTCAVCEKSFKSKDEKDVCNGCWGNVLSKKCAVCKKSLKKAYEKDVCPGCLGRMNEKCAVCEKLFKRKDGEDVCPGCWKALYAP